MTSSMVSSSEGTYATWMVVINGSPGIKFFPGQWKTCGSAVTAGGGGRNGVIGGSAIALKEASMTPAIDALVTDLIPGVLQEGGGREDGDLFRRVQCCHLCTACLEFFLQMLAHTETMSLLLQGYFLPDLF